jgi:imidazolonepropionase-like amidohydrolase
MTPPPAGRWVPVSSLGSASPEYRSAVLARGMTELILLQVMMEVASPAAAAIMYAARGGVVRPGPDGDLLVWDGEVPSGRPEHS